MGWAVFILFMLTAYIPDPLPFVDELASGGILLFKYQEQAVLAGIIICVLFYFGIPPIGLLS